MPFLNTVKKQVMEEKSLPKSLEMIPQVIKTEEDERQIKFDFPIEHGDINRNVNKAKGTHYELYIGSLYEKEGYIVEYNGINRGGRDGGIDLICRNKTFTVVAQCKNYNNTPLLVKEIYQFYGAFRHYAILHPRETVSGSFWTSVKFKSYNAVFKAATDLGIKLHFGIALPANFETKIDSELASS